MLPAEEVIGQINVHIDGLRQLAAALRKDLTDGLRPQVTPVQDDLQTGARVGAGIAGDAFPALQHAYSLAIQSTLEALFNLDLGTQAMADAAATIAHKYQTADDLAHAHAQDVQNLLGTAPDTTVVVGAAGGMPGLTALPDPTTSTTTGEAF